MAEWFPAKERALAMGFFNGGVSIGAILAPFLVPFVVLLTGSWRWAFVVTASLAIPWLYFWRRNYYPTAEHPRVKPEELELIARDRVKGAPGKPSVVLRTPQFWGLFGARLVTSPVWFFISYWIFNYLHREFGFNLIKMAAVAWIPFAFADAGNILGGYLSGKLVARGMAPARARKLLMGAGRRADGGERVHGLHPQPGRGPEPDQPADAGLGHLGLQHARSGRAIRSLRHRWGR